MWRLEYVICFIMMSKSEDSCLNKFINGNKEKIKWIYVCMGENISMCVWAKKKKKKIVTPKESYNVKLRKIQTCVLSSKWQRHEIKRKCEWQNFFSINDTKKKWS